MDGMVPLKTIGQREKTPGYTFLFRVVDAGGEYSAQGGVSELSFVESTGHEFVKPSMVHEHPGWFGVAAFTRAVLPRRDKRLKIRVKEQYGLAKILEFDVENPAYRPVAAEWVPDQLPVTKTFEGLPVTLTSVEGGAFNVNLRTGIRGGWMPDHNSFWVEDVTGNRGQTLSPFEPAWKLHMQLTPMLEAMPPDQVWTIDDIAVPLPGQTVQLNLEKEFDGVQLRLDTIQGGDVGSGQKGVKEDGPWREDQPGTRDDCPRLLITARCPRREFAVSVRLTWNKERIASIGSTSHGQLPRDIDLVFRKLPADSRIKVEVGVGRPRDVDFLVAPDDFRVKPRPPRKTS
jgi:hypothetical protein